MLLSMSKSMMWVLQMCLSIEPTTETYLQDKTAISKNIETQARHARALFIWTDCDREGEHIGSEVRTEALKSNPRIQVKRARFSNIERAYVSPQTDLEPC